MHTFPGTAPFLVMELVMLAMAAWLLYLGPRNLAARTFALFLLMRVWANTDDFLFFHEARINEALYWIAVPAVLTLLFVVFAFVTVFPKRRYATPILHRMWWGLLAAAAAALVALWIDPSLYAQTTIQADGTFSLAKAGPLFAVNGIGQLVLVLAGVVFLRDYLRAPAGSLRHGILLVALGFSLAGAWNASRTWVRFLAGNTQFGDNPVSNTNLGFGLFLILPVLWILWSLIRTRGTAAPETGHELNMALGTYVLAVATGVLSGFWNPTLVANLHPREIMLAFWRTALPVLVAYALVRHRMFDIDLKIKWSIKSGTIAGAFVAVFLVVAQLAQNFFGQVYGWALGGVTAGLLLFVLAPIQRVAERIANAAMPGVQDSESWRSNRKADAYRFAVRMALADGVLTREEERGLAVLASELRIDAAQALALREEVEQDLGLLPGPKKARPTRPSRST